MPVSPSSDIWTVKAALDWTTGYLEGKGDTHARLSAEWLLSAATGLSRVELYVHHDRPLSLSERDTLRSGVRRRASGEPLQYVTGEVAFRHIVVQVEPGVLIPRPETEMLVEVGLEAVDRALEEKGSARVLDLCTGSGIIALSLVHEREAVEAVATDISPSAISLAQRNAAALHLEDRVGFRCCDLAGDLSEEESGVFDLVISNPPYIPSDEVDGLDGEILGFEPRLALDGGADGLDIFRRIVPVAAGLLRSGGSFVCELHEDRLSEAAASMGECYHSIEVRKDLAGRDRIVHALKV